MDQSYGPGEEIDVRKGSTGVVRSSEICSRDTTTEVLPIEVGSGEMDRGPAND